MRLNLLKTSHNITNEAIENQHNRRLAHLQAEIQNSLGMMETSEGWGRGEIDQGMHELKTIDKPVFETVKEKTETVYFPFPSWHE